MKNSRLIVLGLLLLVSCNTTIRQHVMQARLANLDSLLSHRPRVVLDSLEQMDVSEHPGEVQSYYNLLLTIAKDKSYVDFTDDSIISLAAEWYRNGRDPEKLARSLIYLGIVRYALNPMDTLPYLHLKEAEDVMKVHAIEDPQLQVLLYGYLGDINLRNRNYPEAEVCFEKGLEASKKAGNHRNYVLAFINLFYAKMFLGKTGEAEDIVLQINAIDSILNELIPSVKKVNAFFYQTGSTFKEAIIHSVNDSLKGMFETDKPGVLYNISQFYMKLNRIDSAVVYGEACLDAIVDSMNLDNYRYYKHLAYLYTLTGEYKESSDNYKKALGAFQTYHTVVNEKRILELEKKYNIAEVQQQLLKEKLKKRAFIIGFVVLFAIALILSFGILYWKHTAVRNKRLEIIQQQKTDQLRFFVAAINCTLGILPDFVANVNRLAHKNRETCPELYHTLQEKIVSINKEYRKSCSAIIQDPLFNKIFNDDNSLPAQLSDREKLIHKLSESGFSNELIAGLLNVTTDNIRSSKSKIKRKLEEN
ncbi:MAG: LuxR C-terminal-related transcriptional regulator [Bacteroidales bacterium]|jgi:tetratricopeptide (TPR) repeat protein|nr:LuxR C-terminal-related transcriptional regulator [Bacteroidales bacterium]MDD2831891.1 LuxR C-terminal-related transcriptional regulator [Bacteroidales bacterium]